MYHKNYYTTVVTILTIIEIILCLAFNMVESFVTKITNSYMVNILAIIIIINSFIEFYGIHKKRHWIIFFSCICKLSAMVYIIGHMYITSGKNYLLAAMSWFALFYIIKIKIVSKSQENSVHNEDVILPKFQSRKQSHVSMTSIVTSSNEPEKKIAAKPKSNIEVVKKITSPASSCAIIKPEILNTSCAISKNNPEFDRLYSIGGMIGKGGFGQIYSGVRNSDLKPVAIKIIKKPSYCSKLVWPTEFDGQVVPLEVFLMQKLNHINGVIKYLEYFETLESYILVLERMVPNKKCDKCQNDLCNCEKM